MDTERRALRRPTKRKPKHTTIGISHMALIREFRTPGDFWSGMVEPDLADYQAHIDDLRAAFHVAISLFHMHDWVWITHEVSLRRTFTSTDARGNTSAVHDGKSFANSLEQQNPDFGRIRSIANAAKHLELRDVRPVPNAASRATDTSVHVPGAGLGGYGVGAGYGTPGGSYAGRRQVMLEGALGQQIKFFDIAKAVYHMWTALNAKHGWW